MHSALSTALATSLKAISLLHSTPFSPLFRDFSLLCVFLTHTHCVSLCVCKPGFHSVFFLDVVLNTSSLFARCCFSFPFRFFLAQRLIASGERSLAEEERGGGFPETPEDLADTHPSYSLSLSLHKGGGDPTWSCGNLFFVFVSSLVSYRRTF